ncbi:MAG: hypothetical protein FK734_14325 [Asgard group archaeon]|nr:hypothetical protein [Asgard group archaeon]
MDLKVKTPGILLEAAETFIRINEYEKAISYLKEELKIIDIFCKDFPKKSELCYHLEIVLENLTELKEIENVINTHTVEEPLIWYNIACAYALLERNQKAIDTLQIATEIDIITKTMAKDETAFKPLLEKDEFKSLIMIQK